MGESGLLEMLAGGPQGPDDVGGSTRSGDADDGIFGVDVVFLQLFPAAVHVVLGILDRVAQGDVAAGNESDDQRGRHAERGGNLRSVEHTQPSAGAGAHVEDAAALFHAGHDLGDEFLDLGDGLLYGQGYLLVFGIDLFQNLTNRFFFEVVV